MGNFIGHAGGFIILAAVTALAAVFTLESGIVKNRDKLIANAKVAVLTAVIGIIYYFIMAYMRNILSGQTNVFDFNSIFSFKGIDKTLEIYQNPEAGKASGVFVPVFPWLVNRIGGLIFGQYGGTAVWLNFLAVCTGACCLHRLSCDFFKREITPRMIFYILALPYAVLLFTPGYWGITFGLIGAAAYSYYKKKYILFGILAVLAVLMSKLGLAVIIIPVLGLTDFGKGVRGIAQNRLLKNTYLQNAVLYLLFIIDAVIMFRMVAGG